MPGFLIAPAISACSCKADWELICSGDYSIDALRSRGTEGWPIVPAVMVLVPIYTDAGNAHGEMVLVVLLLVYAMLEVTKLVHASLC